MFASRSHSLKNDKRGGHPFRAYRGVGPTNIYDDATEKFVESGGDECGGCMLVAVGFSVGA